MDRKNITRRRRLSPRLSPPLLVRAISSYLLGIRDRRFQFVRSSPYRCRTLPRPPLGFKPRSGFAASVYHRLYVCSLFPLLSAIRIFGMRDELETEPTCLSGWRHAIVVGAGIGGLLTGRILADHFSRVTILERDTFVPGTIGRKGVPQGRHLHSLATRGAQILEWYFPGLDAELADAGCPVLDQAWDVRTDTPAGRLPRFRSDIMMRAASRSLLEERVRERLEAEPEVRFLTGLEASGLVLDAEGNVVVGVWTRRRGSPEEIIRADLVVDASGQGSRAALARGAGVRGSWRGNRGCPARLRDPLDKGAGGLLGGLEGPGRPAGLAG